MRSVGHSRRRETLKLALGISRITRRIFARKKPGSCNRTIFNEQGDQVGGVVIAEVADLGEMREFSLGDPFVIHGIYGASEIFEWRVSIDNRQ